MATGYRTSLTWDITDDGEVVYGPATEEYRDFLTEMNKWYNEGLLHPDFATTDNPTAKALYNSGSAVAVVDSVGAMTGFISSGQAHTPDFMTRACPYPVPESGMTPYRGYRNLDGLVANSFIGGDISEDKLETALRFMDYGYSEEGKVLYNFGREGVTFNYEDDSPVYTNLIMDNPEGINKNTAIRLYTMAAGLPGEQMIEYYVQNNNLPAQMEALPVWSNTDQAKHAFPGFAKGDADTEQRLSVITTDLDTYRDEMMVRFIMGTADLNEFDSYIDDFKSFGLEEALELKTKIYEDYMAIIGQ
jgi:putative aldouronate transport system substrate-binding protein